VRILGPSSEDEMIAVFLRGEQRLELLRGSSEPMPSWALL
jgi:hypothetical protein